MNKRLLIITNDGGKKDFLPGVELDREGYLNYFRSCYGGAWDENEIICPVTNKMSRKELFDYIENEEKQSHVDYWLIVFCGHGGADREGRTFLELSPEDTPVFTEEIESAVGNSRLLLIADSCRVLPMMESGGRIPRTIMFSDSTQMSHYRNKCRNQYNEQISSTPNDVHTIGYAAQLGQYANELDNGEGGQYSQALLGCAKRQIATEIMRRDDPNYVFEGETASFSFVHECAKTTVKLKTNGKQIPHIKIQRARQLPFWIVPPK